MQQAVEYAADQAYARMKAVKDAITLGNFSSAKEQLDLLRTHLADLDRAISVHIG